MLKLPIKYVDFDNVEREEDHYFNLTHAELAELELNPSGDGLSKMLETIIKTKNQAVIVQIFKKIIIKAHGIRTLNGDFIKNQDIADAFAASPAYSALFMKLGSDAKAAADFINGIIPRDLAK